MSRGLLDVNVLLALFDSDHVDHGRAWQWMEGNADSGWASCAITANGFVRIISQPRYPNSISPADAMARLAEACSTEYHEYWACSLSLVDAGAVDPHRVLGSRQVTDAYLLALAVKHAGCFVTFDRNIPIAAVRDLRQEQLVVI
jgi:toxin-antitoxin system PIN domain toxin